MIVATFNCNSIRQRAPIITAWLKKHEPDVLALQETKVSNELFPEGSIRVGRISLRFPGQGRHNGVATSANRNPTT